MQWDAKKNMQTPSSSWKSRPERFNYKKPNLKDPENSRVIGCPNMIGTIIHSQLLA